MITTGGGGDLLVRNIGRLTTWDRPVLSNAALLIRAGKVAWYGADKAVPRETHHVPDLDAGGAAVLPGFVDCHTHLVWAGSRRADFVGRVAGGSYTPQGINSTVAATRVAPYDELLALAQARADRARSTGTTTIEVKSGYGLTPDHEMRLLDVANQIGGIDITATYLGAHVVPGGRDRDDYVDEVIASLPEAKRHGATWCDVFCDEEAFSIEEARRILNAAEHHGFGLRIHAEQLSHTGAALLAAELGCASADHLDFITERSAAALAHAGVIGVLVPVCSLYTRSQRWDHARVLKDAGVTLAIATDCNPGTAWCESMPYAMQLACLAMGLPVDDVLRAATIGGAMALQRADVGHLAVGAQGNLVVLDSDHEADLVAHLGSRGIIRTVVQGSPVG